MKPQFIGKWPTVFMNILTACMCIRVKLVCVTSIAYLFVFLWDKKGSLSQVMVILCVCSNCIMI